ncbi:Serine hydrolase [Fibrobacter sp. UWB15]|jgi:predicted alpha/beta hydrolase family esterase|nr:serine hydrolase [Fibrobacter sp. UWB6]SHG31128.1 Serine hydrolase [Fibrobacter sp. UWB8]SMG36316.1 Serine hydrolase [Fibrobacter sp. UWB15]
MHYLIVPGLNNSGPSHWQRHINSDSNLGEWVQGCAFLAEFEKGLPL